MLADIVLSSEQTSGESSFSLSQICHNRLIQEDCVLRQVNLEYIAERGRVECVSDPIETSGCVGKGLSILMIESSLPGRKALGLRLGLVVRVYNR
jgi:hypothetical protein